MPELTSGATFGGSPYASPWDDLPLPGGRKIGQCDTDNLRSIFHALGVSEAHTAGRNVLCERYRQMLAKIGGEASDKAVMEFLEKHNA